MIRVWHHNSLEFLRLLKLWHSKTTSTKPARPDQNLEQNKVWSMPTGWTSDQDLPTPLRYHHFLHMIEFKPQSLDFSFHFISSLTFHWHQGLWSNFGNSSNVILCILTQSKASLQFVLSCFPLRFVESLVFHLFSRSVKFSLAFTRTIYFPFLLFLLRIQTLGVCTSQEQRAIFP